MNQMNNIKDNPFEEVEIAKLWSYSVEEEKDLFRDKFIYPKLQQWIDEYKPTKVLDIGAGQGIVSKFFKKGEYLGIEPSATLVNIAKEKYGDDKFVIGNAYNIPALNSSFDGAISINVWFHLEDLLTASKELSRILKKDGHFLIITVNPEAYSSWIKFYKNPQIIGKRLEGAVEIPLATLPRNVVFMNDKKELFSCLEKSDLCVTEVDLFSPDEDGINLFCAITGYKK
jgi:ubiquinone/menaquinone biosynthesis C-methylase UbiE